MISMMANIYQSIECLAPRPLSLAELAMTFYRLYTFIEKKVILYVGLPSISNFLPLLLCTAIFYIAL
jgi:hypothetical protein